MLAVMVLPCDFGQVPGHFWALVFSSVKCGWCEIRAETLQRPESLKQVPELQGCHADVSSDPIRVSFLLGFGLTEHQAQERKIGLHFEKAVRALFFEDICNQISQNRNQTDCQLGAVQGAATVRTKMSSEMTKPRGRKWGKSTFGVRNGSPWWPRP